MESNGNLVSFPTRNVMDQTLTITAGKIHSTLFEKELNLYLYIPPHSSHPKGMLSGLINGNVLQIYRLCSNPQDITIKTHDFFNRLQARGYTASQLTNFPSSHYKCSQF